MRALIARGLIVLLFVAGLARPLAGQVPEAAAPVKAPQLTLAEQEAFLMKAKVTRTRGASKGITGTLRATMTDGTITHDASIQCIDEYKQRFESTQGTEFNFRDTWRYNVAGYRLDRLLDLGMIPPSVERSYNSKPCSFTWWVDDVLMDEGARIKQKVESPDGKRWNEQMWHVRLFDQLIYNVDRNLGNLLIDNDWRIWMIDHSRAFRTYNELKSRGNLSRCDRRVLDRLKALDKETLSKVLKDYLMPGEITSMLKRRDTMVEFFEKANAVFDWERPERTRAQ